MDGKKTNRESVAKWRSKNPEEARRASYQSTARTFARHYATAEDMEELMDIFQKENPKFHENN